MSVLISGASGGIGRELAIVFAAHGYDIIAVGRNVERLDALASELADRYGARTDIFQKDLGEPNAARELVSNIESRGLSPDILVNNAAALEIGGFSQISVDRTLELVVLNVVALTALTRLCLPAMLKRGTGRILNVASVAAFGPAPSLATYGATKAFALSLSEALSEELAGTGVSVTALCPGATDTGILQQIKNSSANAETLYSMMPASDPREVAAQGYDACMRGVPVFIPGVGNQLVEYVSRWQPRWMARTLLGAFGRQFI